MLKSMLLCGGSVLAAAIGLASPPAFAAAPASAVETGPSVGELVVVAEKREQKLERVPVAITAFSAQQRALQGIVIFNDIADMTPGLSWTDIDDRIYIRGIGRNSDNLNNTSGVAIYYNGIYYGANAAIELQRDDLFIGGTEVDKGPQNTLHGSNADGGVVEFTSQRPTNTPYAEGRIEFDNYSTYRFEGVVSGPIDDHWKFRLGANYTQQNGGFFNNLDGAPQGGDLVLGGGGQTHYLEGQLEGHWDHFDLWTLVSSGNFAANTHGTATLGTFPLSLTNDADTLTPSDFYGLCGLPGVATMPANVANCGAGPPIVPGSVKTLQYTGNMFPGNNPGNLNPRDFINEFNSINYQQRNIQVSVNATWHAPGFDMTYLGGYQQFHYILRIPNQAVGSLDAGVLSWEQAGLNPTSGLNDFFCLSGGFTIPQCEQPLKIYPTPNYLIFNEYDYSFSHELDFTSTWEGPFQYIAGLYWYHEHYNQPVNADTMQDQPQMLHPDYVSFATLALTPAPFNPSQAGSSENTEINYDSYAVFGQGTYKFNNQWKLNGAVRYTEDEKKGWQTWRVVAFDGAILGNLFGPESYGAQTPAIDITALAACGAGPVCEPAYPGTGVTTLSPVSGAVQRTLNQSFGAFTGEADVDWTPDPTTLVYAKYSRGYKSGGWSTYTFIPNPEVKPEFVDAYEGGFKKTFGSFLTVNADGFYYNYYGEQTPLTAFNPVTGPVGVLYNIPLVHNYGAEMEAIWRPINPLTLSLTYAYLNARIAQSSCFEDVTDPIAIQPGANTIGCKNTPGSAVKIQNIVGQWIPGATPNHVSFNALYTIPFEPGKLTLSATYIWKDGTYDSVFNRWYNFQPAYSQVNLRATWTDAKDRFTVVAFVNNLFNTLGYDGAAGVLLAGGTLVNPREDILSSPFLTAPRTFGVQFQYRWR